MASTNFASIRRSERPVFARRALPGLALAAVLLASACNLPASPLNAATATQISARQTQLAASYPSPTPLFWSTPDPNQPPLYQAATATPVPGLPGYAPTATQVVPVPEGMRVYYSQSGDTLAGIASHFLVRPNELQQPLSLGEQELLPPGTSIMIPNRFPTEPPYPQPALPDADILFSPGCGSLDLEAWIQQGGGYLADYYQYIAGERLSAAEIIRLVAVENSINPRLLLALVEFRSGWLFGFPPDPEEAQYPIGYHAPKVTGLFDELTVTARVLGQGYYGWRQGKLDRLIFRDDTEAPIHPALNAGSVGIQNLFAALYTPDIFHDALYGPQGFLALYARLFGDPWARSAQQGALLPAGLSQPALSLPFLSGLTWGLTSGPHITWQAGTPRGALDFAPRTGQRGCYDTPVWVTASAGGLVVRSQRGAVAVDLDGDGDEGTGWVILYMHLAARDRVPLGTWVEADAPLGHPSCEGGVSTGTHLHIARKYNGEWIPAEGPLPLVLDGWQAYAGTASYSGWLIRGGQTVVSNVNRDPASEIRRDP